jgi:hypothetical protein
MLHHQELDSLLMTYVVKGANIRVLERCDGSGFALEALQPRRIGRQRAWDHFDGNNSIQPNIPGAVHLTHSAGSKQGLHLIGAKARASGEKRISSFRLNLWCKDGSGWWPGCVQKIGAGPLMKSNQRFEFSLQIRIGRSRFCKIERAPRGLKL